MPNFSEMVSWSIIMASLRCMKGKFNAIIFYNQGNPTLYLEYNGEIGKIALKKKDAENQKLINELKRFPGAVVWKVFWNSDLPDYKRVEV